jgi:hypothetical protein
MHLNVDLLWSTFLSACEVLCAATGGDRGDPEAPGTALGALGLVPNHAYAITRAVELADPFTGAAHRLLKLRNPHGRGAGWRGDWGPESRLWTEELRAAVGVASAAASSPSSSWASAAAGASGGAFWLCLRDLRTHFREVATCRCTEEGWAEARVVGSLAAPRPGSGGAATLDAWSLEVQGRPLCLASSALFS